jgi:DNA-binding LacI/PurR family transcriptional regulator
MQQPEPPTAIFCLQDAYMSAVLEACQQMDIHVPRHLEIVSFNDCPPQFLPLPVPVLRIVQQCAGIRPFSR